MNKPNCPMCGQPMATVATDDRKGFGCAKCGVAFPVAKPHRLAIAAATTPAQKEEQAPRRRS